MDRAETLSMLRDVISRMCADTECQQAIQGSVKDQSLRRWISGESVPRESNLRLLQETCPQYRVEIQPLIEHLYPSEHQERLALSEIPAAFYRRVIQTMLHTSDPLRYRTICFLVMRQMLQQLDPDHRGYTLTIGKCVKTSHQVVPCLQESVALGGEAHWSELEHRHYFLGMESPAGRAVTDLRAVQCDHWYAVPLHRAACVAGCLLAYSPSSFFSSDQQLLVKEYAALLTLALDLENFYDYRLIRLVVMPSPMLQQPFFANMVEQQIALMKSEQLSHEEAEVQILTHIIDDLLHFRQ